MNSVTTTFAYRGDGLRNSRTTGGTTTTFTWDIAGGLPVVLDDGAKYVYGAGLVSQVSGANTYYYLADGLGSTMKTVDATGTVVNGYTWRTAPDGPPVIGGDALTSALTPRVEIDGHSPCQPRPRNLLVVPRHARCHRAAFVATGRAECLRLAIERKPGRRCRQRGRCPGWARRGGKGWRRCGREG